MCINPTVITIGTACMDEYYHIDQWLQEGDKSEIAYLSSEMGGMIPNASCVLAGLGVNTRFFDRMNSGATSHKLLEHLNSYCVDTSLVTFHPSLPDAKCFIFLSDKERTVMAVNPDKPQFTPGAYLIEALEKADYIYTTPHDFQLFSDPCEFIRLLKSKNVKIAFDVENHRYSATDISLIDNADILFFNEFGFQSFCNGKDSEECIRQLSQSGVHYITITLGSQGCLCYHSGEKLAAPGFKVQVIDPTGAGDTFNAAFLWGIIKQYPLYGTAAFANAAAALSVTKAGPKGGVNTEEAVLAFMEESHN